MTNVSITEGRLVVEVLGWDKLWSLKSRIEVPLAHVREVRSAAGERARGLRMPGTYLPGLITAGIFEHDGQREFWAVHNAQQTVAIALQGEFFSRVVVQVPDPAATVAAVQKALTPVRT
ncbi:MAG: hypothetical protein INR62_08280 [Rhodospirillales bacterium]|nr:hypothetical protein [Acetobacter sp.]